jgi:hypothetical protein
LAYSYNDSGQITRIDEYGDADELTTYVSIDYDENGNITALDRHERILSEWLESPSEAFEYTYESNGLLRYVTNAMDRKFEYEYNRDGRLSQELVSAPNETGLSVCRYAYGPQGYLTAVECSYSDGTSIDDPGSQTNGQRTVFKYERGFLDSAVSYTWNDELSDWSDDPEPDGLKFVVNETGWIVSTLAEYQEPSAPAGHPDTYSVTMSFDEAGYPVRVVAQGRYWDVSDGLFKEESGVSVVEWERGPLATDLQQLWFQSSGYLSVPGYWFLWMIDDLWVFGWTVSGDIRN